MQAGDKEIFADSATSNGNDEFMSLLVQKETLFEVIREGISR